MIFQCYNTQKPLIGLLQDYDHYWKEYPSGRIIDFHYTYPCGHFNPKHGEPGDTLIWYPKSKDLRVVRDTEDNYPALCYRPKFGSKTSSKFCHNYVVTICNCSSSQGPLLRIPII